MKKEQSIKCEIIYTDGRTEETKPKNGKWFTLEEMQEIVGGLIELVHLRQGNRYMVVNEEGKVNDLPYNEVATTIFANNHDIDDIIVGNVLICPSKMIK